VPENQRKQAEALAAVDKRVARIEWQLGIVTPQADTATPSAASEMTRGAGATNQLAHR
jgi:hypothetical protein